MNRVLKSFGYALKGMAWAFRQRNLKIQVGVSLVLIGLGWYFGISSIEWCLVLLSMGMVMGAETLNTALEELVDHLSPGYAPWAGRVKDLGAGAVLLVSLASVGVGLLVFGKYLYALF